VQTDADLIAAAQAGEPHAVDKLLERYQQRIYRFGLRMCGDEESAREVLQETMLAAFRHLATFRGEAAVSTWLYQIARSFCIKQRRGEHRKEPIGDNLVDPAPAPDATVHARQIGAALAEAIAELPAEQREVLVLRDVEGLSAAEAAKVVGVEVGALKSRLHRARMALRQRLAGLVESAGEEPCPDLAHELSAYAGSEIDQATCARIETHLATCPRCSGTCDALKRTVSLCRSIPGEVVPEQVRTTVRSAILAAIGR